MIDQLNILAQEESSTLKVIIGIVFAGIWIIAQILSSVGKKKEKPPPQADYPIELPRDSMPVPVPAPPPRQQRPVKQRVETKQRQREQQRRPQSGPTPPPLVQQTTRQSQQQRRAEEPVGPVDPHSPILAGAVGSKGAGKTSIKRSDRLRALLRPGNLRKEYILTELFQPPVSQRPERF
jgi:type IV secretory pathway VirB10-like protein